MAEALVVAGSIITVMEITAKIGIMCSCYLYEARNAAQDIKRVSQKTSDLQAVLHRLLQKYPRNVDPSRIRQCSNDIAALQERIDPGKKQSVKKDVAFRELKWPLQKAHVEKEVSMLEGHLKFFGMITNLDIKDTMDETERSRLLGKLAPIGRAVFNSNENKRHRQCLNNTRVGILDEIDIWASNGSPQCIFRLKGMAGTGKSTIALTIGHSLDRLPSCVMASYFFKRGGGDLACRRKLLPTLIHQMANKSPAFCNSLLPVIRDKLTLGQSATMKDQFDKLLIGPLRNLKVSEHNFVWVIDALDECDKIFEIRLFLRLIAQTPDIQNLPLRVFVSSRPEISIQGGFGAMPQILHHDLALHKVPRTVVDAGITNLFNHELESNRADQNISDEWPSKRDIQNLVFRAA